MVQWTRTSDSEHVLHEQMEKGGVGGGVSVKSPVQCKTIKKT